MYKILEDLAKSLAQSSENPLFHIPYRLLVARGSGYKKQPKPDFDTGIFGWFDYKPVGKGSGLKPISIKNQVRINNCVYQSTIGAKEIDEGVELSVKSLTIYAKIKGLLVRDGWSSTENGEKALRDFGACLEKDLPSNEEVGWERYSDTRQLTPALMEKAKEYKSKTFWSVMSEGAKLKLLDEGTPIKIAIDWFTGFNQGGGFRAPWIISKKVGVSVGGWHQFYIFEYNLNYYGQKVYKCANSYDKVWGDDGCFYITFDYLRNNLHTATANLDIDRPVADIITQYAQMNVQGSKDKAIYHISMGKKRVYPDWRTFVAWDGYRDWFAVIPQEDLDKVPTGDPMNFDTAPRKDLVENINEPINWNYNKK